MIVKNLTIVKSVTSFSAQGNVKTHIQTHSDEKLFWGGFVMNDFVEIHSFLQRKFENTFCNSHRSAASICMFCL